MPLKGNVKNTYDWFNVRIHELEARREKNNGKLPRHDWWRYDYYKTPYLLLEENQTIEERFTEIFTNSLDISVDGKITLTWMVDSHQRFGRLFTELIEETNWRGILTHESMEESRKQVNAYFSNGTPLGVRLFGDMQNFNNNWLLKFSKKEFIEEMYEYGRIRISPASYYSKGSHIRAVKDFETIRSYRLKAINDVIGGTDSVKFRGEKLAIVNGVVPIEFVMGDYYLFSTCKQISRRMPTDFDADSVLIIQNKSEFIKRIETELLISYPEWEFLEGDVYYYDPYAALPTDRNQEFYKNLSYAYQHEHRCIIRPKSKADPAEQLEPFFIELGSLNDIAEILSN